MDSKQGQRILKLKDRILANFKKENWIELGLFTGCHDIIKNHDRLLRSLLFDDDDYSDSVLNVITEMTAQNNSILDDIDTYLNNKFEDGSLYVSARPSERKITFAPNVFEVPNTNIETDLVAVMMPFDASMIETYKAIEKSSINTEYRVLRADDLWENSVIIQDIFSLIYRSSVVIVDFSGKNSNVMYETGIAHTLGKLVIPISQSLDDVPFDMRHHRVLTYLPNTEGLQTLSSELETKLKSITKHSI